MSRTSLSLTLLVFLPICITAPPSPALAQYMYLDSNGDGIHTAADVLNGTGTTQVDIWLRTNHQRDGSVAICSTGEPYTFNSYTVILRATDGSVNWIDKTNRQPTCTLSVRDVMSPTEFYFGYVGSTILPPGDFLLARVSVAVLSGAPAIAIVPASTLYSPASTSFGSQCSGPEFNNTMTLGSDWFDVDGLTFSAGGSPNTGPSIPEVADVMVSTGDLAYREITATDPDGDDVTCSLVTGPAFVHVTEIASSPGARTVRIQARPHRGDTGTHQATIAASDGFHQATRDFAITVSPGPNHDPRVAAPKGVVMPALTVRRELLTASDADGDVMAFSKVSGPAYAEVHSGSSGQGGSTGHLVLQPSLCDVGSSEVVVGVSDGTSATQARIQVSVLTPSSAAGTLSVTVSSYATASGDLNEDGHMDVVSVNQIPGELRVLLGEGTGALAPQPPLFTSFPAVAVGTGDWNHDGHTDIASGPFNGGGLVVLYGHGDGTFAPTSFADVTSAQGFLSRDLNWDGIDDLVVTGGVDHVSVLLGHEASGLTLEPGIPTASGTTSATEGDFDLDGTVDLALTNYPQANGCSIYFGRGDGTFGDPRQASGPSGFYPITAGDWNLDGKLDLAASQWDQGDTYIALGYGTGDFNFNSAFVGSAIQGFSMEATEWNGDGNSDLLVSRVGPSILLLTGGDDGTFTESSLPASAGYGLSVADLNGDGRPDVVASDGRALNVLLNTAPSPAGVSARAFTGDRKVIAVTSSSNTLQARVEPVDASFTAEEVDPASLRLTSDGTGSVSSIVGVTPKSMTLGDSDRNGVIEFPAGFAMADVARLFDGLHGKQDVSPHVEGSLRNGKRFCAPLAMAIIVKGGGGALAARVEPNPLNPTGVLRFSVERQGPVTVRLFDLSGRLIRTIWDRQTATAGVQEVAIDGRDAGGRTMATGVYFFRIEAEGRSASGRFTVLK
jgi:hypothetical protein